MNVSRTGWVIIHPNGWVELDFRYRGCRSREEWRKRYRPDCTMHKARLTFRA